MKKTLTSLLLFSVVTAAVFLPKTSYAKAYSKAFLSDYDTVWKGVLIALSKYPLDKNDQEAGEIVTSLIKPGAAFTPYQETLRPKELYQLFIEVQKIVYKNRKVIRVKIEKRAHIKGDFINAEQELVSNGIEENILLYRTAREVKIDRTIEKLFNK